MSLKKIYIMFSMVNLLSYARVIDTPIIHNKKGTETINEEVNINLPDVVGVTNKKGNIVFQNKVNIKGKVGIKVESGQVLLSNNVDIDAKKAIEVGNGKKTKALIFSKNAVINIKGDIHVGEDATLKIYLNNKSNYIGDVRASRGAKLEFNLDNSNMESNILEAVGTNAQTTVSLKNNSIFTLKYDKEKEYGKKENNSSINVTMDNSILNLDEPNKYFNLGNLTLNNSILNLWDDKEDSLDNCRKCSICKKCKIQLDNRKELNISELNGNGGTINVDVTKQLVRVLVGSGNHNIVQKHSGIKRLKEYLLDNNEGILVVTTAADLGSNFVGVESEEAGSLKKYKLKLEKKDSLWFVTDILENDASILKSFNDDGATLYNLGLARLEIDTLHQRMGELNLLGHKTGVWARVGTGQHQKCDNFYLLQVGIDRRINPSLLLGVSFSNKYNYTRYSHGKGYSNITSILAYLTYLNNDNKYYIDLIGKYSSIKNQYNLKFATFKDGATYRNSSIAVGVETGKKYMLNENLSITPLLQATYTHIGKHSYKTNREIMVDIDSVNSVIGKLGINFGYKTHYLKLGVLHEFLGDARYVAIDKNGISIEKTQKNNNTWFSLGIGGTFNVDEKSYIYYDFEKTFSNCMYSKWQISLGYRYEF